MAYIPMNTASGGGTIVTKHVIGEQGAPINIAVNDNIVIPLTQPEAGYIPISWNMSVLYSLTQGKMIYFNGVCRDNSGWKLYLGNVGASDIIGLWCQIKIAWVKE